MPRAYVRARSTRTTCHLSGMSGREGNTPTQSPHPRRTQPTMQKTPILTKKIGALLLLSAMSVSPALADPVPDQKSSTPTQKLNEPFWSRLDRAFREQLAQPVYTPARAGKTFGGRKERSSPNRMPAPRPARPVRWSAFPGWRVATRWHADHRRSGTCGAWAADAGVVGGYR